MKCLASSIACIAMPSLAPVPSTTETRVELV